MRRVATARLSQICLSDWLSNAIWIAKVLWMSEVS